MTRLGPSQRCHYSFRLDKQFVLCLRVASRLAVTDNSIWLNTGGSILEQLSTPAATVSSNIRC